jgi:hypothetical protein
MPRGRRPRGRPQQKTAPARNKRHREIVERFEGG